MLRSILLVSLAAVAGRDAVAAEPTKPIGAPAGIDASDWPWWRGPHRDGVAPCDDAPLAWSADTNVLWSVEIPGRGHSAPTVVGDRLYLTTADETKQVQSVRCHDRATGKLLWQTAVHEGGFDKGGNRKSSHASGSVACDGERLFVNFLNRGAVWTTALALDGDQLWQRRISKFVNHQGFGSSPSIYGDLVIVTADNKGGGVVAGLDRKTGKVVWNRERPAKANYTSAMLFDVGGKHQAILIGCDLVTGLDPKTGRELWEIEGSTTECVTSTVVSNGLLFTSGGYPRNHVQAIHADGSGKTAWAVNTRLYVPSMLALDGHLYMVTDAGIAVCHDAKTGEEIWKHRIGGTFNASLVRVADRIYATDQSGRTTIFRATTKGYEQLGQNQLGNEVYATPTIVGGRIYHRVAMKKDGERRERLYCLAEGESE